MRCHKCNQESISIEEGHIVCDICGLDIDISLNLEEDNFFDLFFYNKNLEEAEKLGHEAMIEGKELGDNPYSVSADQIILNKRWELGYNAERISYEFSALSLSSEKIENDLKTQISQLVREKQELEEKIDKFTSANCKLIDDFCCSLIRRKILGRFLNKDVLSFRSKYRAFHSESMGAWKFFD